jgi:sugar transferase (PEP-CTERM/EpsH1 system associated)
MVGELRRIVRTRPPDVVLAYCSGMARFAVAPPLDGIPMVLDFVDIDSRKWRDLSETTSPPMSWVYRREAATLGAFEARAARHAAAAIVVNEREAAVARQLAPEANIHVVPNGVETRHLRPAGAPPATSRIVFCGVMNYAPNDHAMQWFVRHVWPLVRAERPDATLAIVGSDPTAALQTVCAPDQAIHITGRVADVREWLWESAVAIAPLQVARGVQNKVLEAVAAGLPVVITDAVAAGLPPLAAAVSVANDAESFARRVLDYLSLSPAERRARAATADLRGLEWSSTLAPLWTLLKDAGRQFAR